MISYNVGVQDEESSSSARWWGLLRGDL